MSADRSIRLRRVVGGVVLAAALVGAAGCETDRVYVRGTESMTGGPGTVAVIGDSLVAQTYQALHELGQGSGLYMRVDGRVGHMTREQQPAADEVAPEHPEAVLLQLGTNDLLCAEANERSLVSRQLPCRYPEFTVDDMAADMARQADALHQPGTCVVAVNAYYDEAVGETWQALADEGRLDGVIDWRSRVDDHQDWLLDPVGHLSDEGRVGYSAFVIAELRRICAL